MRVLFQTRPDHPDRPGGDRVMMEELRDRLIALGLQVDFSSETAPDLRPYDIVHLFNLELIPHTFLQAENARRRGRPYVLTPTYWTPRDAAPRRALPQRARAVRLVVPEQLFDRISLATAWRREAGTGRAGRCPGRSRQELRAAVLDGAAHVFASCEAERKRLGRDFPLLPPENVTITRFGHRAAPAAPATVPLPAPGYFLCVGAFGPRKNQLNVARALRSVPGARLVLVGGVAPGNEPYHRAVIEHAPPGATFVPDQPRGALPLFYERARAVVQASFVELPGLVAVDALAALRPVVAGDHEPAREYFQGLVTFADPSSPRSIRDACLTARAPDASRVAGFLAAHDWSDFANHVHEIYLSLSGQDGGNGATEPYPARGAVR